MYGQSKTQKQLEALVKALDDMPPGESAANIVARLGIDVKAMAEELKCTVAKRAAEEEAKKILAERDATR